MAANRSKARVMRVKSP